MKPKTKQKISFEQFIVILIISVLALIFNQIIPKVVDYYFSTRLIYVILFFSFWLCFYFNQENWAEKIRNWKWFKGVENISLVIFIVGASFLTFFEFYYRYPSIAEYFKNYSGEIDTLRYIVFIFSLAGAFFYCWFNYRPGHEIANEKKGYFYSLFIKGDKYLIFLTVFSIAFVVSRVLLPIIFTGSYRDEFFHIDNAQDLFRNIQITYSRGYSITYLVSVFFRIFGESLFVAKFVPVLISLVNYVFFLKLIRLLIKNKTGVIIALLIYLVSPWLLINHYYIRFYVLYETFILVTCFLLYKVEYYWGRRELRAGIIVYLLCVVIQIINMTTNTDIGRNLVLLYFLVYVASLIYKYSAEIFNYHSFVKYLSKHIAFSIVLTVAVFASIVFVFQLVFSYLGNILYFVFWENSNLSYDFLFIFSNSVFFIFFLLTIIFIRERKHLRHISLGVFILFVLHFISSPDMQMIRAISYLLPLFYLIALIGFTHLFNKNNILKVVFIVLFVVSIVGNFPVDFFKSPYIPGESVMLYVDMTKGYRFVSDFCQDRKIYNFLFVSSGGNLFNIQSEIYNDEEGLKRDTNFYYDTNDLAYKTVYKDKKVIAVNDNLINSIIGSDEKVCMIYSPIYQNVITQDQINRIVNARKLVKREFVNISVFYN